MSSVGQVLAPQVIPWEPQQWFALQTMPRHEKKVADNISRIGIVTFLPLVTERHRWSDRCKVVQQPLFPCYLFVALDPLVNARRLILQIPGVLNFVGSHQQPTPISQADIDTVKALLVSTATFTEHPFLKVGQRVRIRSGALAGLEGLLVERSGGCGLVISIEAIQRSLLVRIEGYGVEQV